MYGSDVAVGSYLAPMALCKLTSEVTIALEPVVSPFGRATDTFVTPLFEVILRNAVIQEI